MCRRTSRVGSIDKTGHLYLHDWERGNTTHPPQSPLRLSAMQREAGESPEAFVERQATLAMRTKLPAGPGASARPWAVLRGGPTQRAADDRRSSDFGDWHRTKAV